MKTSRSSITSSSTTSSEPQTPNYHPCPHQHFRCPLIDRSQLNPKEHIALLATPRGYRWAGGFPPNYSGPKPFSLIKPTRKKYQLNQKKLEEAEQRYMQQFVSQIFPLMSAEMVVRLKRMLVVEFGMTPKKAGEFIKSQNSGSQKVKKNKGNKCYEIDVNIKGLWLKEFERLLTAKMTDYLISMMCARRSKKVRTIAQNALNQMCDITGECCSFDDPQNKVQRIQVFMAERFAVWLANLLEKADNTICEEYSKWPSRGSEEKRRSSITSATLPEAELKPSKEEEKEIKDVENLAKEQGDLKPKEEKKLQGVEEKEQEGQESKEEEEKQKEIEEPKEARLEQPEEEKSKDVEGKPKEETSKDVEEKPKEEEEKSKEEMDKLKEEEEKQKMEKAKQKELEEQKLKEEEERKKELEEQKLKEEEERKKELEDKKQKEEEVRKKELEEKKQKEEEEQKLKEEEEQKKELEEKKQKEEEERKKELEEQKLKEEEERKKEIEEQKLKEEERKNELEEKKQKEEEERKRELEEKKQKEEERKKELEEQKQKEEEEYEKEKSEDEQDFEGKEKDKGDLEVQGQTKDKGDESATGDKAGRDVAKEIKFSSSEAKPISIDEKDTKRVESDSKTSLGGAVIPEESHSQKVIKDQDKIPTPLHPKTKGAYRIRKDQKGCFYEVKKIDQKEICDRTKIARKKRIAMVPTTICARPKTSKIAKTPKDMKKWAKWATDVANFVEKWSNWIVKTTEEVEARVGDERAGGSRELKEKTEIGILELKRNKKYIKETSKGWEKKLNKVI